MRKKEEHGTPGSSMCAKSHSMAASGSLFPVASKAFWHRTSGNPITSSCASAASLNSGSPPKLVWSVCIRFFFKDQVGRRTTWRVVLELSLVGL